MTLRCGILTLKTSDLFFRSFRFSRQNETFSATEQNQTYKNSLFFRNLNPIQLSNLPSAASVSTPTNQDYSTLERNSCVLASFGLSKISSGVPCSRILPSSINITRVPTSFANPISWVTTAIVIP